MKWLFSFTLIPAFFFAAAALGAETYSVTDLGTLPDGTSNYFLPAALNDSGEAVGSTAVPGQHRQAALVSDGTLTSLGAIGGDFGYATAINRAGQIVGYSGDGTGGDSEHSYATLYGSKGSANTSLGTLPGGFGSAALGINTSGQAVGYAVTSAGWTHAALFSGTGSGNIDLGVPSGATESYAYAINDAGQIVGMANSGATAGARAMFFGDGPPVDLGSLRTANDGTSTARAINNSGQIVGEAQTEDGHTHAVLFSGTGSGNTDLGSFFGESSSAKGINDAGEIVGTSSAYGFLYTASEGLMKLNDLIDPEANWRIAEADAINASGQILGIGYHLEGDDTAQYHAVLLTPGTDGGGTTTADGVDTTIVSKKKIIGAGVINLTGAHQTQAKAVARGQKAKFTVVFTNHGTMADTFTITATGKAKQVAVFDADGNALPGANTPAGFTTSSVLSGTSYTLAVVVKAPPGSGAIRTTLITVKSATAPAVGDAVKLKAQAQ